MRTLLFVFLIALPVMGFASTDASLASGESNMTAVEDEAIAGDCLRTFQGQGTGSTESTTLRVPGSTI